MATEDTLSTFDMALLFAGGTGVLGLVAYAALAGRETSSEQSRTNALSSADLHKQRMLAGMISGERRHYASMLKKNRVQSDKELARVRKELAKERAAESSPTQGGRPSKPKPR